MKNLAPMLTKLKDQGFIEPMGGGIWKLTEKPFIAEMPLNPTD